MQFKIQGGTVADGHTSLCHTCRFATVIRGARLADEAVVCAKLMDNDRITFSVKSCSAYSDRSLPSLYHMEDIAWILRSDAKRKTIGFVRAKDLKPSLRHVLDDDD